MATHIALHETGAAFESRLLSFNAKEQQRPDYLALNPEGKVPALVVDGQVLTEVAATLYYLAKTYPAAGLWPRGGFEEEAQAVSWMSFIASTVHPARRAGNERWREVFHLCEQRLADKATDDRVAISRGQIRVQGAAASDKSSGIGAAGDCAFRADAAEASVLRRRRSGAKRNVRDQAADLRGCAA